MKILIILNLFISLCFANEKELDSAINYIKNIITQKSSSTLKTEKCDIDKSKWINLLLTKTSFTQKVDYNTGCDLKGSFTTKMDYFFKVPLQIRDKRFKEIKYLAKLETSFEKEMQLILTIKDGLLIDKDKKEFKFNATQTFTLDPFNKESPIKKSKLGELNVIRLKSKRSIKL